MLYIILGIIAVIVLLSGFYIILKSLIPKQKEEEKKDDQSFLMLQNQLGEMRKILDVKLGESGKAVQHQFS